MFTETSFIIFVVLVVFWIFNMSSTSRVKCMLEIKFKFKQFFVDPKGKLKLKLSSSYSRLQRVAVVGDGCGHEGCPVEVCTTANN